MVKCVGFFFLLNFIKIENDQEQLRSNVVAKTLLFFYIFVFQITKLHFFATNLFLQREGFLLCFSSTGEFYVALINAMFAVAQI